MTELCWRSRDQAGYLCRRERPFLEWILIMLLMLNLLVVCNNLVSSFWLMLSYGFWHFHHPYFAILFGAVHCPFLTLRVVHTSPVHPKPVGGLLLILLHINPYIFLKTATIPTYHSISIAVPRYIAMQLPFYITWLVVIYHLYIALHDSIQLMCGLPMLR